MRRPGLLVATFLLGAACEAHVAAPPTPPETAPVASAAIAPPVATVVAAPEAPPPPPVDPVAAAADPLRENAVFPGAEARVVLYTWTTKEQIKTLRHKGLLLTRTESPTYGASFFDHAKDLETDPTAATIVASLNQPRLAKRRFGWSAPWATLAGLSGSAYGTELLRVVLKPEAVIATYEMGQPWTFTDIHGAPIEAALIAGDPARIGAIYHVFSDAKGSYREYVLCNEELIESWSYGTPLIKAELAKGAAALRALEATVAKEDATSWGHHVSTHAWRETPTAGVAMYEAALASTNPRFQPTAASLEALAVALEKAASEQGPAFTQEPNMAVVVAARTPPAPRIRPSLDDLRAT